MRTKMDELEKKRVQIINYSFFGVFAVLTAGGFLIGGLDFAVGVLLGCLLVAINFFSTQKLAKKLLLEKAAQPWMILAYILKFGISIGLLFLAVTRLEIHVVGLMVGLSSIIIATVISTILRGIYAGSENQP